jgi:hypothetical protein
VTIQQVRLDCKCHHGLGIGRSGLQAEIVDRRRRYGPGIDSGADGMTAKRSPS